MASGNRFLIAGAILAIVLIGPATAAAADGAVYLYLQPLPAEAVRLTFALGSMTAVSAGGTESTVKVYLPTVSGAEAGRQRLLASARLPYGTYAGFMLKVRQASLKEEKGQAALTVPDAPVRLDVPFVVGERPTVIWLSLRYQDSVTAGFSFTPVFAPATPPRPIADHVGFVSNATSNTLTVFDKNLGQVVAVADTCAGPAGLALDQHRRRLYVACAKDDEVRSIDVSTGEFVERSRLSPGDRPRELALSADGATLISVNSGSNSVSFYDALSLVRRDRVNVGSGPGSIVIEPAGRRAFVLNTLSSSISVLDVVSHVVLATLSTEASPLRAEFNTRGDRLYVIYERSPYMTVFDPGQLTIVTRARLRIGVSAIALDTVRDLICIGADSDGMVEFYDPNALMPVYSVKAPSGISYLTFDAEDNRLYIVSAQARTVSVVRLTDRKLASQIDVGDAPYAVAIMGEK